MDDEIVVYSQTQIIEVKSSTDISVINAGPPGPPGMPGEPGEGGGEEAPQSIIVESPGAVTTWDIPHDFDHDPSVEIRDTTDRVVWAPTSFSPGMVHIDISPSNITLKAKLTP